MQLDKNQNREANVLYVKLSMKFVRLDGSNRVTSFFKPNIVIEFTDLDAYSSTASQNPSMNCPYEDPLFLSSCR